MLSSTKNGIKELAKKLNYPDDVKLDKEDVGAYLFNYKKSSSRNITVEKIKITDSGFEVSTIDETIDALNEISEKLFLTMKYGIENE